MKKKLQTMLSQVNAVVLVFFCDVYHEAEVSLYKPVLCGLVSGLRLL